MEQNWTPYYPIMPLSGLTGFVLVLQYLTGSAKADLHIYTSFAIVYGQCLSVAIIISNKFLCVHERFSQIQSHNYNTSTIVGYNRE